MISQIQTVEKSTGKRRYGWVESAGRSVAGFLEVFQEGCRKTVTCQIQKQIESKSTKGVVHEGNGGGLDHCESFYYTEDEYDEDGDEDEE